MDKTNGKIFSSAKAIGEKVSISINFCKGKPLFDNVEHYFDGKKFDLDVSATSSSEWRQILEVAGFLFCLW